MFIKRIFTSLLSSNGRFKNFREISQCHEDLIGDIAHGSLAARYMKSAIPFEFYSKLPCENRPLHSNRYHYAWFKAGEIG